MTWTTENNTTPQGLLTSEQREAFYTALKNGAKLEEWDGICWETSEHVAFYARKVYRTVPEPKRISLWINRYERGGISLGYLTREAADVVAGMFERSRSLVYRIEADEDGGSAEIFVEEV